MRVARRVTKLEKLNGKKSRRFLVRYENSETGLLELTDLELDEYTKIFVVQVSRSAGAHVNSRLKRRLERPGVARNTWESGRQTMEIQFISPEKWSRAHCP
jgi:hypothetical protein